MTVACAMPAAVPRHPAWHSGDRAPFPVGDEHGHAVGHPDADHARRIERNDRVGFRLFEHGLARPDHEHAASVDLFERDDFGGRDIEGLAKAREVAGHAVAAKLKLTGGEHVVRQRFEPPAHKHRPAGPS
jgi:hypothetical protein